MKKLSLYLAAINQTPRNQRQNLFSVLHQCGKISFSGRLVSYHLQLETLLGAFCCPVPWTYLLLTRIYQHFYTTGSPNIRGQCGVCAATSAAKQSGVILVRVL